MPKKSNTKDNKDSTIRHNWGKSYTVLPKLDLLAIQKRSYERFLETTIGEILEEISPIDDFTGKNLSQYIDKVIPLRDALSIASSLVEIVSEL